MEIQSGLNAFDREDERGFPRLSIACAPDDPRAVEWRAVCIQKRRPFAIVSESPGSYATVHVDIEPTRYQWRRETVSLNPVLQDEAGAVLSFMVGESDHPIAEYSCTTTVAHAGYVYTDRAIAFARWLAASVMSDGKNQGIIRDVVPDLAVVDLATYRSPRLPASDADGYGDAS